MGLLARTLTRDTLRGITPGPAEDLRDQFLTSLIEQDIEYGCGNLEKAIALESPDSLYSREIFKPRQAIIRKYMAGEQNSVYYGDRLRPATKAKIIEEQMPELKKGDFWVQMQRSLKDRTVVYLQNLNIGDMLGLAPADACKDDEVWILSGAKTPVVLRRKGGGRYEFLGEAYVHGVMHGEASSVEDHPRINISLI